MTTVNDICSIMEDFAPTNLAMDWDNVGLMLGRTNRKIEKVLLALDLTQEVVEQAIAEKVQMIITHHPAIFKKFSRVTDKDWQQNLILTLAENKIAVYSAHTNYDCADEGVNHVLASIGCKGVSIINEGPTAQKLAPIVREIIALLPAGQVPAGAAAGRCGRKPAVSEVSDSFASSTSSTSSTASASSTSPDSPSAELP